MLPDQYERRVLVGVTGLSPQVITETLYGLAFINKPSFIPTEIHLVTTLEGAHRAKLDLLHEDSGKFLALCREYELPPITFNPSTIHVIKDSYGHEMDDIRTPEENEAAADYITGLLSSLTQDANAAIHVSIAGGRKTMGYYLGYALSLFGREQDRLSHVLVSDGYESHKDFFYPTLKSNVIYARGDRPLDTSKAEIALAQIPFIRIRDSIPENLRSGKAGFLQTINLAKKAEMEPELIIDMAQKKISANGVVFTLKDILFAFYCWVIEQTLNQQTLLYKPNEYDPEVQYAEQFIAQYIKLVGANRDIDKTLDGLSKGMDSNFFSEKKSRINQSFKQILGKRLAENFEIKGLGRRGDMFYATRLKPEQVVFGLIQE
jgi:CRISPR-associated protein (TIGR02584 family)